MSKKYITWTCHQETCPVELEDRILKEINNLKSFDKDDNIFISYAKNSYPVNFIVYKYTLPFAGGFITED
jgi:hypothetical protein